MEEKVSLQMMLEARERRAARQEALLKTYGATLISYTMNIAGPVKTGVLIGRAFKEGIERLDSSLKAWRIHILHREEIYGLTGPEALLSVEGDPQKVKKICAGLEDEDSLGRLFDMDVLTVKGEKLEREAIGFPPRRCIVCGRPGKGCASRRIHPLEEVRDATDKILRGYFSIQDGDRVAREAERALLYEVCVTPKPGLVDRMSSGSHKDMNLFTFIDSATALSPYFSRAHSIGLETSNMPHAEAFPYLRREGLRAEKEMFSATNGVNTHKGAIFSLGVLCCAAGRLWTPERPLPPISDLLNESAALVKRAVEEDFSLSPPETNGLQAYIRSGSRGIRGEVEEGFPSVRNYGLPAFQNALDAGASLEEAGTAALIALISHTEDTNLLARGGAEGAAWAAEAAGKMTSPIPELRELTALDDAFTARGLSPGGCADLLAVIYFLTFLNHQHS